MLGRGVNGARSVQRADGSGDGIDAGGADDAVGPDGAGDVVAGNHLHRQLLIEFKRTMQGWFPQLIARPFRLFPMVLVLGLIVLNLIGHATDFGIFIPCQALDQFRLPKEGVAAKHFGDI